MERSVDQVAQAIVDRERYMTLGTVGDDGLPWVSPVWFAPVGYRELLWVSSPEARHSRNVAARPAVSVVIFDSGVELGRGEGVYMTGSGELVAGDEVAGLLEAFSARSLRDGGASWGVGDVQASAPVRLYRAVVAECWLGRRDERVAVSDAYWR